MNKGHGAPRDHKVLSALTVVEAQRGNQVFLDQRVKRELAAIRVTLVPSFKGVLVKPVMRENGDLLARRVRKVSKDPLVKRDLQDRQDRLDLKANAVISDPRENAARWVLLDLPVIPDLQARRVFQVIADPKENKATSVPLAILDMQDLLAAVFLVPPAKRVNLVLLDPWDLVAKRAFLVSAR